MKDGAADAKRPYIRTKEDLKIRLEVGKWYEQKDGEVIKIVSLSGCAGYPFRGSDGETYTTFGAYYISTPTGRDILKEVPEPVSILTQIFKFFSNSI